MSGGSDKFPIDRSRIDKCRIDKWLWAVRIFKTRAAANEACSSGKVRVNGDPAKPATKVKVGDHIQARAGGVTRQLEVTELLEKRVGAATAATAFVDHTPPAEKEVSAAGRKSPELDPQAARRDRGAGRPTKRERRDIDRLRRR